MTFVEDNATPLDLMQDVAVLGQLCLLWIGFGIATRVGQFGCDGLATSEEQRSVPTRERRRSGEWTY